MAFKRRISHYYEKNINRIMKRIREELRPLLVRLDSNPTRTRLEFESYLIAYIEFFKRARKGPENSLF